MAVRATGRIAGIVLLAVFSAWQTTAAAATSYESRSQHDPAVKKKPPQKNSAKKSLGPKPARLVHRLARTRAQTKKPAPGRRAQAVARKPVIGNPAAQKPNRADAPRVVTAKPPTLRADAKPPAHGARQTLVALETRAEDRPTIKNGGMVCRREGRIYLLADCGRPLPPPADETLRDLP